MSKALDRVPFGRTDMRVSRVGLGSWAIGGKFSRHGWGPQDDDVSIATIHRAVAEGVNWVDTAPIYGVGHSEEVVGKAIASLPEADRPYVFTKCGLRWDDAGDPSRIGADGSLREEVENSLKRLGVERIDLYQMHWPPFDETPVEDYWATLLALKDEGKVRAVGMSNHDVPALERAQSLGQVESMQPPLSAIRREAAADIIPWCEGNGTAVITYAPMQNGLLTGALTEAAVAALADHDDWRSRNGDFKGDALRANLALADALRTVAARRGVGVPAIAVAWVLAVPGVTAAIVGARAPEEVGGWIDAASLRLTDAELDEIAESITATGAGAGPARPGKVA